MQVSIHNAQKSFIFSERSLHSLVKSVLNLEKKKTNHVAIYFVTKAKIATLHEEFFDDPSPTDCITFPLDDDDLGEIFICPQVAKEYVKKNGGDLYEEVSLYIVHALLHLCGYDDMNAKDLKKMRAAEQRHMENLRELRRVLKGE